MFKLFEWIGSVIAVACLIEIASNPPQVLRDIQNGPMPNLAGFNNFLQNPPKLNGNGRLAKPLRKVNGLNMGHSMNSLP